MKPYQSNKGRNSIHIRAKINLRDTLSGQKDSAHIRYANLKIKVTLI
jgi:hypothetical protein